MKAKTVLLSILCVLLILCIPCVVSFGAERTDIEIDSQDEGEDFDGLFDDEEDLGDLFDDDEEEDLGDLFGKLLNILIPAANAEEAEDPYALPIDITVPGMEPNPKGYRYNENLEIIGYTDDSINVELKTIETDKVIWRIAWVTIKSPTQIRTGIAGNKVSSKKTAVPTSLSKKYNAVIAMNGDDYQQGTDAKYFEYRMGEKVRSKSSAKRDILIIDENGDLNIFVKSNKEKLTAFSQAGHKPINAFTFGPALVIDGEIQQIPKDYKYNPNNNEPRSAIGQVGELSYVLVVAETLTRDGTQGVTMAELADFMKYELGCIQAYNLDGGNTAEMVINHKMYMSPKHAERDQYDIIYFASAVDPAEWKN